MTSPEKVLAFLERLQSYSDRDLSEALSLPIPAPLLRMGLAGVAPQIPTDAAELDGHLSKLGEFVLSLRSDDHAPA